MGFMVLTHAGMSTPVVPVLDRRALATLPGEFAVGDVGMAKLVQSTTGELCAVIKADLVFELLRQSAKSDSTREAFFHMFSALRNAQSQIAITSAELPKDIPTLEERLSLRHAAASMAAVIFTGDAAVTSGVRVNDVRIEYCPNGVNLTEADIQTRREWSSPAYVIRLRIA